MSVGRSVMLHHVSGNFSFAVLTMRRVIFIGFGSDSNDILSVPTGPDSVVVVVVVVVV